MKMKLGPYSSKQAADNVINQLRAFRELVKLNNKTSTKYAKILEMTNEELKSFILSFPGNQLQSTYIDDDGNFLIESADEPNYRVLWFLNEHEEYGAILGDPPLGDEPISSSSADIEDWAIYKKAAQLADGQDSDGFYWISKPKVMEALESLNLIAQAVKAKLSTPDWAIKALKEGWQPPPNWKP